MAQSSQVDQLYRTENSEVGLYIYEHLIYEKMATAIH